MANVFDGMVTANIAQKGFALFLNKLMPLRPFTTDFSNDVVEQGDTVTTRVVPQAAAAEDLQIDLSGDRDNAAGDVTTVPISVVMNQQPIRGFHLTDEDALKLRDDVWSDTALKLSAAAINSVADATLNFIFNLITNAAYGSAVFTGAASTFDLDDVIDINTTLSDLNWPMGEDNVAMVLTSPYYGALKKDNAIQDLSASGIPVVKDGDVAVRKVDDFDVFKAVTLPPSGGTPASENLTGFVATPDAIAIAFRPVISQAPEDLIAHELMVDERTGIMLLYRAWYKRGTGRINHTYETFFGASVAKAESLKRIVSA